jgi:hypothetical protein
MAAFEFGNYPERTARGSLAPATGSNISADAMTENIGEMTGSAHPSRLRSEPLLALKIYGSCRHKNCLGLSEIGPARCRHEGKPIHPPHDAQSVTIENLHIRRIVIAKKEPNPLKSGFWDLAIRYIFDYDLHFTDDHGEHLHTEHATNSFTRRSTLFGSTGAEVTITTDLFNNGETTMGSEPFVMVEAKALGLAAEILHKHHKRHHDDPPIVAVTIGLFSIIKLFRLVSLQVESRGFVIPDPCGEIIPPNPCDMFEDLDFPMDSFAPPQRQEFTAGISGNIPSIALAEEMSAE